MKLNPRIVNFDLSDKSVTYYSRGRWLSEGWILNRHVKCFYFTSNNENEFFTCTKVFTGLRFFLIVVINQHDKQNFCFTIRLFHASTCFEHMVLETCRGMIKHIVKQKFCVSSWLITKINVLRYTVSKTSKFKIFFCRMRSSKLIEPFKDRERERDRERETRGVVEERKERKNGEKWETLSLGGKKKSLSWVSRFHFLAFVTGVVCKWKWKR